MPLTIEEVERVARLARLALTEAEKAELREQLSTVLDYIEVLSELDLEDVPPTAHAVSQQNVLRPDIARPSLPIEEVLRNAPAHTQEQFLIQAVLDEA
ncbi:MAG: Asp-tRNA(Asn)/Glu-tRNA(Gln) amidotransferase subunit GatC [Candidatus Promineifilaceae bacterium]|nr:Asp-tRNA(Asn)/Glu-tRNA(Gln) amidotransferase subunit GatC [Candidatus Promineifilaceae bacterium]